MHVLIGEASNFLWHAHPSPLGQPNFVTPFSESSSNVCVHFAWNNRGKKDVCFLAIPEMTLKFLNFLFCMTFANIFPVIPSSRFLFLRGPDHILCIKTLTVCKVESIELWWHLINRSVNGLTSNSFVMLPTSTCCRCGQLIWTKSCHQISDERCLHRGHLRVKRICVKWIPQMIQPDQKRVRVDVQQKLLKWLHH